MNDFFDYAKYLTLKESDGELNKPFEDFLVFTPIWAEFAMLCMGGELS